MGPKLVASAAVLTLVAWGALSGPAMADASQCPASRVCLFSDSNYVGLLGYRQAGLALTNISSSANDKLTSWINKTSTNARWYVDANGGGGCNNMMSNDEDAALSFWDDNEASSWATNGKC